MLDAHLHAFQDDLTERASLDRINRAKEHWRAYLQQAALLSKWRAEDRALRSSRARPVVCVDCGARELENFYRSREGGSVLCVGCFQARVERGVARKAASPHP